MSDLTEIAWNEAAASLDVGSDLVYMDAQSMPLPAKVTKATSETEIDIVVFGLDGKAATYLQNAKVKPFPTANCAYIPRSLRA